MRLTSAQVERTLSQFDARPVPDDHPMVPQLNDLFGDHTFFLDGNGLSVLEPVERAGTEHLQACKIVSLANWTDENLTSLAPHEPEATEVVVVLEPRHDRDAPAEACAAWRSEVGNSADARTRGPKRRLAAPQHFPRYSVPEPYR